MQLSPLGVLQPSRNPGYGQDPNKYKIAASAKLMALSDPLSQASCYSGVGLWMATRVSERHVARSIATFIGPEHYVND